MSNPYITLTQAKDHLSIEDSFTLHDARIEDCIGGAIDWAENFTNRSLDELLILDSPADSKATAIDDSFLKTADQWGPGFDWSCDCSLWTPVQFRTYWSAYLTAHPGMSDNSKPLRRDAKQGILLKMEMMFDRNIANFADLQTAADDLLRPYRIAWGV